MKIARTPNGTSVRLTAERWAHIAEEHGELIGSENSVLDALTSPERILAGYREERLAVKAVERGKWLVVVYRERGGWIRDHGLPHSSCANPGATCIRRRAFLPAGPGY